MSVRKFQILIQETGQRLRVDLDRLGEADEAPAGSLLQILLAQGILVEHACGGVGACSTCHVHILEGEEFGNEPSDLEEDALERAPGLGLGSRLACLFRPDSRGDLVVSIPAWNRNQVREHP
jgi:2Fe-2S ferredoxin